MSGRKEEALGASGRPPTQLGMAIRAWRRHRQLSVTDLAERAGFGPTGRGYISKIEHGYIKQLGSPRLRRIADALGISSSDLLACRMPPRAEELLEELLDESEMQTGPGPVGMASSPRRAGARREDTPSQHASGAVELAPGARQIATALAEAALDMQAEASGASPEFLVDLIGKIEAHLAPKLAEAVHAAIEAVVWEAAQNRVERMGRRAARTPSPPEDMSDATPPSLHDEEAERAVAWVDTFLSGLRAQHAAQVGERVPRQHAAAMAYHVGPAVEQAVLRRARDLLAGTDAAASADSSDRAPRPLTQSAREAAQAAARAAIHFVHDAGDPPTAAPVAGQAGAGHGPHTLFMVFRGATDVFDDAPELRDAWHRALHLALARGWHICHLMPRQHDRARALMLINLVIGLLDVPGGQYEPAYMRHRDVATIPQDVICIPGRGALEMSAPSGHWMTRLVQPDDAPDDYQQLLQTVTHVREDSVRLIHAFARGGQFGAFVAQTEGQPGERALVMAGLSELTVPATIFHMRAEEVMQRDPDKRLAVRKLLDAYDKREQRFRAEVHGFHVRDLCPMSAIERYVATGIYSPDDPLLALGAPPMSAGQRVQHLRSLIRRLEVYPKYELGLLDDVTASDEPLFHLAPGSDQTYWLVKRGHALLLETLHPTPDGKVVEMDVAISEPTIVEAFYRYFVHHLWNQPAVIHDRESVVTWLQRQMRRIPAAGQGS